MTPEQQQQQLQWYQYQQWQWQQQQQQAAAASSSAGAGSGSGSGSASSTALTTVDVDLNISPLQAKLDLLFTDNVRKINTVSLSLTEQIKSVSLGLYQHMSGIAQEVGKVKKALASEGKALRQDLFEEGKAIRKDVDKKTSDLKKQIDDLQKQIKGDLSAVNSNVQAGLHPYLNDENVRAIYLSIFYLGFSTKDNKGCAVPFVNQSGQLCVAWLLRPAVHLFKTVAPSIIKNLKAPIKSFECVFLCFCVSVSHSFVLRDLLSNNLKGKHNSMTKDDLDFVVRHSYINEEITKREAKKRIYEFSIG
jgi:polyhydroxyalkanoate synthesis regulator phasin